MDRRPVRRPEWSGRRRSEGRLRVPAPVVTGTLITDTDGSSPMDTPTGPYVDVSGVVQTRPVVSGLSTVLSTVFTYLPQYSFTCVFCVPFRSLLFSRDLGHRDRLREVSGEGHLLDSVWLVGRNFGGPGERCVGDRRLEETGANSCTQSGERVAEE